MKPNYVQAKVSKKRQTLFSWIRSREFALPSLWRLVLLVPAIGFLALTLGPLPTTLLDLVTDRLTPIASAVDTGPKEPSTATFETIFNIVLPAISAFCIRLFGLSFAKTICGSAAVVLAIELLQNVLPARDASVRDIVLNLLGVIIGVCVFAGIARILRSAGVATR